MKKILILQGGFNEEHEVSLSTAKEVKKARNIALLPSHVAPRNV